QSMTVEHTPPECFAAGRFPVLSACASPSEAAQRARIYFRDPSESAWHHVEMPRLGRCFRGVLPKPDSETRQLSYYIEVLDRTLTPVRPPAAAVPIVLRAADCTTLSLERADVQVGATSGPEAAKPAGGGGSSKLVALGVVAGGVAAAGLAVSASGGDEPT